MRNIVGLALCFVITLAGCAKKPPSCGDSIAKDTVIQIASGQLEELKQALVAMNNESKEITYEVSIKNIRTTGKDSATGNYECAATIDVDSNSPIFKQAHDVTYTTEITEDSHKAYVTLSGF